MDAVVYSITHPLDPLSLDEIGEAVAILKDEKALSDTIRFPIIRLEEPTKTDMAAHRAGHPCRVWPSFSRSTSPAARRTNPSST